MFSRKIGFRLNSRVVSTSRSPDRIFLTDLGSPIAWRALKIAKGDFLDISLSGNERIKNVQYLLSDQWTPSRHHLELQDRRDYTPADRAARTCWLGCPGLPVLSGGLRRKTQLFSVPSTWPLPPRPHRTSPKVLKKFKTPLKCQCSQGAVRCVIIPKVKNHQTQLHSTQSWSATGLRGQKNKDSKLNTKKARIEQKKKQQNQNIERNLSKSKEKNTLKEEKGNWSGKKRAENREGSLGFPGFVKPVFTKDSKPLGRRKKITRAPRERETRTHLKKVSLKGRKLLGNACQGCNLNYKVTQFLPVVMHNFYQESGIRGGMCLVSKRYSKANNKYLDNFDEMSPSKFIISLDVNNLYGTAMGFYSLPESEFRFLNEEEIDKFAI
ncbi:uncharacterized protein TNCV_4268931 [Trichonephila clavipes]|nr:uncharacterized protein TNCV_4268931 [Trichonephila clavipes]